MNNRNSILKIVLPTLYIVGWLVMYSYPRRAFHVGGDNGFEGWILYFSMFLVLPFLLYQSLKINGINIKALKGLAYGSVFLAYPFSLLIDSEEQEDFEIYKKETIGTVSEAWMRKQNKGDSIWSVQVNYEVEGETYRTSTKDDVDRTLNIGDTVTVSYSSKTPEMSKVKELLDYYKE
ncbi:hypothetical protein MKJ04_11250 [Pontibacter sp. E15-1]|uniref:DUF3592 domain-containing protein n=1 Tax=Pontibacter sp. E15-1 TaxID=2919918 RepID=UPI001F4F14D2|nr:hypothetical protein [Pontibacter sp. E15-1]MCJ8165420.1 hypothetical protein [Pontibacter sp. E15-1]